MVHTDIPFQIQIALGIHPSFTTDVLLGFSSIVTSSIRQLWNAPEAFEFINVTPSQTFIVSDSPSDTIAGTGARTVLVRALLADLTFTEFFINLNGLTPVPISPALKAVNDIFVVNAGNERVNVGNLFIYETLQTQKLSWVSVCQGVNNNGSYHVPKGKIMFFRTIQIESPKNNDVSIQVIVRNPITDIKFNAATFENQIMGDVDYSVPFTEGMTLLITAITASGGGLKTASSLTPIIEHTLLV